MKKELCFDPRDPSQDVNDPATWKPTDNPALLISKLTVQLARKRNQMLPEDYFLGIIEWANYCDEPVDLKHVYRSGGYVMVTLPEGAELETRGGGGGAYPDYQEGVAKAVSGREK